MQTEQKVKIKLEELENLKKFLSLCNDIDIEIRKLEFELNEKKHARKFINNNIKILMQYDLSEL